MNPRLPHSLDALRPSPVPSADPRARAPPGQPVPPPHRAPNRQVPPQRTPSWRSQLASSHSHRRPELCPPQLQRPHWHRPLPLHSGPSALPRHPASRSGDTSSASEHSHSRPRRPGAQLGAWKGRDGGQREVPALNTAAGVGEQRQLVGDRPERAHPGRSGAEMAQSWDSRSEAAGAPRLAGRGSPAHPTLQAPLAPAAVGGPALLAAAAAAVTHGLQLHDQLLREAPRAQRHHLGAGQAVGSSEGHPEGHLRAGEGSR